MNALKKYLNIVLLGVLCITMASCNFETPRDRSYNQPTQVGFRYQGRTIQGQDGNLTIQVQLIGPQRDKDLTVSYQVVDSLTTAQEGVQYNLPTNKQVTIAKNTSTKSFSVQVAATKAPKGQPVQLTLQLTGTDNIKAAPNLSQYQLVLEQ